MNRQKSIGLVMLVFVTSLWGQSPFANVVPDGAVFICPMDPDVRSSQPGNCAKCGMKMVAGLPDPVEYHLDLDVTPRPPKPGDRANLTFSVHDPWKDRPVTSFQTVHEKLFHMFVVSQDLQVFVHDHPTLESDGNFHYGFAFPKPGMYRILGDFYPDGATPQLIAKTVMVPGAAPKAVTLARDYAAKNAANLAVEMVTEPAAPIVGMKTIMSFQLKPGDGLEKYLSAWGHMLVASDDLIDLIHLHPFFADGGPQIVFNVTFPRARPFRVLVQFQRNGVVNTAHFDIPVQELK